MADFAAKWSKFWAKNPDADEDRVARYLKNHGGVATWLLQQTSGPAPDPAPATTATDLLPQPATQQQTGIDFPAPDPAPAAATASPSLWKWLQSNPTGNTSANLGIWAAALGLVAWLILRKRK